MGREGFAQGIVQAERELTDSIGAVRNFGVEKSGEFRVGGVDFDHAVDEMGNQLFEGFACALADPAVEGSVDLFNVALMQRDEDGAFVGEILIDGADAGAGCFSNAVSGDGSPVFEQADDGLEDGVDGFLRPALSRLAAPERTGFGLRHIGNEFNPKM